MTLVGLGQTSLHSPVMCEPRQGVPEHAWSLVALVLSSTSSMDLIALLERCLWCAAPQCSCRCSGSSKGVHADVLAWGDSLVHTRLLFYNECK